MSTPLIQALADPPEISDSIWASQLRHDLANVMTVISGCCELLDRPGGLDYVGGNDRKQLLDHINNAVKRAHALLLCDKRRSDQEQHRLQGYSAFTHFPHERRSP